MLEVSCQFHILGGLCKVVKLAGTGSVIDGAILSSFLTAPNI